MSVYILCHIIALGAGILMDWIIGDPHSFPHPVRLIGANIAFWERKLFPSAEDGERRNRELEQTRGAILSVCVLLTVTAVTGGILWLSYWIHPFAGTAVETVMTCFVLAARSLWSESMKVPAALKKGSLKSARRALSMIVGRDTEELTEAEVIKAAVETVAENTSDGVIAPLLMTALGGPILGFAYKAVNTMDSMIGYHNDRYEYFGKTAARMDDVLGFVPSRISAVLMIASAFLFGVFSKAYSGKDAWRIWRRDRRNHLSPNSAQTESACAGALGLQLGGPHYYSGVLVEKPAIGDPVREPVIDDVSRAGRLMFAAEVLAAAALGFIFSVIL